MPLPSFRDNVVVITGGSSGIGREMARQLARGGAKLVLAARDKRLLEQATAECRSLGAPTAAIPTDVANKAECGNLIDRALAEFGRIDTLVNNAGISMHSRFDELNDLNAVDRIIQVNLLGSIYCTHFALPHLKKTRGRLVAVSSITGKAGVPTRSVYAASKHGMAGFFDSLRIELAPEGVSVTVVYPGFVATGIAQRAIGPDGNFLGERPVQNSEVMPADECARIIIDAAARRDRERLMSLNARLGLIIKPIAPRLVDKMAERAIRRGR
jgi:short-subunit dehydrogenase